MTAADDAPDAVSFEDVLKAERKQIHESRQRRLAEAGPEDHGTPEQIVGLALSGGGERSATFSLGVLQGLARFGLLRHLDYLSTTGGGAEIAGWLYRWIRASGIHEVEEKLSGKGASNIEAPEIQALRRVIAFPKRRSSPFARLAVARNVLMNLLALTAMLGAAILLTTRVLVQLYFWDLDTTEVLNAAVISAVLLLLLRIKRSASSSPTQLRTFLVCLVLYAFAAVSAAVAAVFPFWIEFLRQSQILYGAITTTFCLILGFSRPVSLRTVLVHLGSALAAGTAVALLFYPVVILLGGRHSIVSEHDALEWMFTGLSVALLIEVVALLLYAVLTKNWLSRGARELCWRVCRTLFGFACVLLVIVLTWNISEWLVVVGITALVFLTALGVLRASGVDRKTGPNLLLETLEWFAPFTFGLAITAIVALPFNPYRWPDIALLRLTELAVLVGLPVISVFLLWLIRTFEFTRHRVHRATIVRNYLAPAVSSASHDPETPHDIDLSNAGKPTAPEGPYPLFGAALEVAELGSDAATQTRAVPFIFSPLFSGFELSNKRNSGQSVSEAYRPTDKLGGGLSLATAIAISQPIRRRSSRPPTGATSMLWTILNMRDGRFMGNPIQKTWRKYGPLIEPLYALRETDLAVEVPFVRPSPSEDFDYLGIYQLVKRQCRFIIACDATNDPGFSFEELGRTILRCRTELGVEIQMDLGPLGREPATAGAHYQVARLKYGNGEDGFMVYIKPSLTGDEPFNLVQHARVYPEFPATDIKDGRFGEADFENYRGLGQHIVESVFAEVEINPELHTTQVVRQIRKELQPDFLAESETTAAPETEDVVVPQELVDAIASGECVLCTGSGLAAQAKLPTWTALLDRLLRKAREDRLLDTATADSLAATFAAGEYEAAADELIHEVSREALVEYVRSVTSGAEPGKAHMLLAQMKFLGVLNLSFDELLANALKGPLLVPSQSDRLVTTLQSRKPFVVNLYGTPSQPSSLLFTMKEFRHLLQSNSQLKQFLGTLFLRYCVVFVGMSMDTLRDFMEALELPQTPERKHYALVPNAAQLDPVRVRFFERSYNLRLVDYQPQFNYAGLSVFLEKLQSTIAESLPQARTSKRLRLKSVTLENIGPFHSLDVEFTPQWNLLLGDNGVGKTVLLKAIAAALCGDKTEPEMAARLLRIGAARGSIRLKDESREYVVELERKVDGSVQIVSASLSPIIYERWLVLGFPALRSIPLKRPDRPKALKPEAPSADDLLPLLRGVPDDRVADLKQWLVNLDYARNKDGQYSRAAKLWNDFFRVLQLLTPGLRFEPGNINSKTMEITVVTDSGPVPLEFVSQGTAAVMSWIGTLLERLSETGGDSALVLIDELDAHMHPKWQQLFVTAFREEFKSVQIIATTHSPLLVGSLSPEEIKVVRRVPLSSDFYGVVRVERIDDLVQEITVVSAEDAAEDGDIPEEPQEQKYRVPATFDLLVKDGDTVERNEPMTKDPMVLVDQMDVGHQGWRADQILASPLFQLETTRDKETADMMDEYTHLNALDNLSDQDKAKLEELARKLHIRLANTEETEAARTAYSLIEDFATQRLRQMPEEERRKVLDEVKVQLKESITGSGRQP